MDCLKFEILDPEEIKALAVGFCNISTPEDAQNEIGVELNSLKLGSHLDPSTFTNGSSSRFVECQTCFSSHKGMDCPGHFAYVELEVPVYHCMFMEQTSLLLRAFCHHCYKLRLNPAQHLDEKTGQFLPGTHKVIRKLLTTGYEKQTLKKLVQHLTSKTKCPHCQGKVPKIKVTKDQIWVTWATKKQSRKDELAAKDTYRIFSRISQKDINYLRLEYKPTSLLITVLPIPPPSLRPTIHFGNNKVGQDDLTRKLQDIIRRNEKMLKDISSENEKALQMDVTMYIDASKVNLNVLNSNKNRNNKKDFKSLLARIQTKSGRIRNNLMGKRVDFTARAVVTGDPNIAVDEFGIPKFIAMQLSIPERVTVENYGRLQDLVNKGPFQYPGANNLITIAEDGTKTVRHLGIRKSKKSIVLNMGDIVERHLQHHDVCLINRQPSLHKESMMAVKIRILPGNTFRLNLSVAQEFNADFDGDEMNLHVPQSLTASTELSLLASVKEQFMSAQYNRPGINIVQDTLNSLYLLTSLSHSFTKDQVMQFMYACDHQDYLPYFNTMAPWVNWNGYQIVSLLFPADYDFHSTSITIESGQIIKGYICKKNMGTVEDGILAHYWRRFGNQACLDLITKAQKIATQYMEYHSHTVGYEDLLLSDDHTKQIESIIRNHRDVAIQVDDTKPYLTSSDDRVNLPSLLTLTTKLSDVVQDDIVKKRMNNITTMAISGSKGNAVNARQLSAALGQQMVSGARPLPSIDGRALPHFHANDVRPASRGFVFGNFRDGLDSLEYFFHAQGGREGLTDTSIKTASVGYTQRRVMKALEDITVRYDGTVRNAQDTIIEFTYGDDGKDASYLCNNVIPFWGSSDDEDIHKIAVNNTEADLLLKSKTWIKTWQAFRSPIDPILLPVPIIDTIKVGKRLYDKSIGTTTTKEVIHYQQFSNVLKEATQEYQWEKHPLFLHCLFLVLHYQAATKVYQIQTVECLKSTLNFLDHDLKRADVHAGEAVGALAAQSVGEPLTQMTLNSVAADTELLLRIDGTELQRITIGAFVDQILSSLPSLNMSNGQEYGNILGTYKHNIHIMSCNENGKVTWNRVEGVSRHPVVNQDGSDTVLEIQTKSGRKVIATKGESLLTLVDDKIVPCIASTLTTKDMLPVSTINGLSMRKTYLHLPTISEHFTLDHDFGWLCGIYLACDPEMNDDIQKKVFKIKDIKGHMPMILIFRLLFGEEEKNNQRIHPVLWTANEDFITGILSGYIDGVGQIDDSGSSISANSETKGLLQDIQQLLLYFQVWSVIQDNNLRTEEKYTLLIQKEGCVALKSKLRLVTVHKHDALNKIPNIITTTETENNIFRKQDVLMDPIISIRELSVEGKKVYDLTVADTKNFNTLDGLCLRDTFHFSGAGNDAVVQGIPMFQALLDKPHDANAAFMHVAVENDIKHDFQAVEKIAQNLICKTLKDVADEFSVHYQPNIYTPLSPDDNAWISLCSELHDTASHIKIDTISASSWTCRVQISAVQLLNINMSTTQIYKILYQQLGKALHILVSPILSVTNDETKGQFACIVYLKGVDEHVDANYWQHHTLSLLHSVIVSGIHGIQHAKVVPCAHDRGGYMIHTDGINMTEVGLQQGVDWYRTTCSRVRETEAYLGLLAARELLLETFKSVFQNSGTYVSPRHLKLICDRMTQSGNISRVHRDGTNAEVGRGILDRASYEKSGRELANAALYGETDELRGISSQLCVGKPIQVGTHTSFDVLLDVSALEDVRCPALDIEDLQEQWKDEENEEYVPDLF